jgi:hypothetical protein
MSTQKTSASVVVAHESPPYLREKNVEVGLSKPVVTGRRDDQVSLVGRGVCVAIGGRRVRRGTDVHGGIEAAVGPSLRAVDI